MVAPHKARADNLARQPILFKDRLSLFGFCIALSFYAGAKRRTHCLLLSCHSRRTSSEVRFSLLWCSSITEPFCAEDYWSGVEGCT
jgi:hypothetical protein